MLKTSESPCILLGNYIMCKGYHRLLVRFSAKCPNCVIFGMVVANDIENIFAKFQPRELIQVGDMAKKPQKITFFSYTYPYLTVQATKMKLCMTKLK